jgi:hypothetical protein
MNQDSSVVSQQRFDGFAEIWLSVVLFHSKRAAKQLRTFQREKKNPQEERSKFSVISSVSVIKREFLEYKNTA